MSTATVLPRFQTALVRVGLPGHPRPQEGQIAAEDQKAWAEPFEEILAAKPEAIR